MGVAEGAAKIRELSKHPWGGFDWINNLVMDLQETAPNIARFQVTDILRAYGFELQNHTTLVGYALDKDGYVRESHLDLNLCLEIEETWETPDHDDDDPPPARRLKMLRLQDITELPPTMNFKGWAEDSHVQIYLNPDMKNEHEYRKYLWLHRPPSSDGSPEIWDSVILADRIHVNSSGALEWWYPNNSPNWTFEKALSKATHWANAEWNRRIEEERSRLPISPLTGKPIEMPVNSAMLIKKIPWKDLLNEGKEAFGEAGAWRQTWEKNLRKKEHQYIRDAQLQPLRQGQQKAFKDQ